MKNKNTILITAMSGMTAFAGDHIGLTIFVIFAGVMIMISEA